MYIQASECPLDDLSAEQYEELLAFCLARDDGGDGVAVQIIDGAIGVTIAVYQVDMTDMFGLADPYEVGRALYDGYVVVGDNAIANTFRTHALALMAHCREMGDYTIWYPIGGNS